MAFQYPTAKVHITQNAPDGTATLIPNSTVPHPSQPLGPTHQVTFIYSTPPGPFSTSTNADLDFYTKTASAKPLGVFPAEGGSGCVILDFAPSNGEEKSFIHKTTTVDYLVVLEGTLELELLGGTKKVVSKGEVVVQRECQHSWKNVSTTEGARIMAVAVGAQGAVHGKMEIYGQ
ncbi:uncharacterized protein LY89DRAFT_600017 [Mollisia scopiformis]|uniref:Cupin type-2 domain-containing protein n=1 Tax=Mollisia scopiformis TaxID=149040 RepID=A0A132B7F1_MOLSC|nr:uncharacterized protein LY89DRAFT_600017 [Mollisia scopiformis]KUJ08335.1 hypothetical protein LY89DRAFT_600017 [Mollisia scopiformis]